MSAGFLRGVRATLPIALSAAPFGLAYGATAVQSMSLAHAMLMSVTVFAGTAQFVAASMLAQGAAHLPVLITGLLVNLRLILLSASLTPHVKGARRALYPAIAQLITDESFIISMAAFRQSGGDVLFFLGSGLTMFVIWQIATTLGGLFSTHIPNNLGLEYALPASLICLLFLLLSNRRAILVALLAAGLCLALRPLVTATWSVMAATLMAATLGTLGKRWRLLS
jgi:4-azaleucine resistance transporter AzlC